MMDVLNFCDYSKNPVSNPAANPSIIGKGNPGKIPLFSSIKNVMIEPAKIPIIAIKVGIMFGIKLKKITPINIE